MPTPRHRPPDFAPAVGADERAALTPRLAELAAFPGVVDELKGFSEYTDVLSTLAPAHSEAVLVVSAASQWTAARNAAAAWQIYCVEQEGLAWRNLRALVEKLRPRFNLAVQENDKLSRKYPKIVTLLTAHTTITQKGAATRRLNEQAKAEGKLPTHGKIGKQRQRAAEKAALLAQTDLAKVTTSTTTTSPPSTAPFVIATTSAPATSAATTPHP